MTTMQVSLIAHTTVDFEGRAAELLTNPGDNGSADYLAEFAGRACYESWDRPNAKTAANVDYLAHIIDVGHFSVLEHASATFYIQGVSRSLTHELVRHRHLSFSQRSQRYVDESDSGFVVPPDLRGLKEVYLPQVDLFESRVEWVIEDVVTSANEAYDRLVDVLIEAGHTRKEARQAARSVLPNGTATNIVVTGNMRAWREFVQKRWHVAADKEIQQLALIILECLKDIAPHTFQDITEKFGTEQ